MCPNLLKLFLRYHPRIRGEHSRAGAPASGLQGSSPHTRGALCSSLKRQDPIGIIPAYAGSTLSSARSHSSMWDHPRIRGEHSVRAAQSRFVKGSSPHTRGARTRRSGASAALGIIPAYAGSTSRRRYSSRGCRDHPRIRGEHSSSLMLGLLPMGSSPHTRGALERSGVAFAPVGIIPAYAGSTSFVA